jgi:hypothetical protein
MSGSDDVVGVIATINLYAFATDSQRWELFDRVFTPDVLADFGEGIVWKDRASLKTTFEAIHKPFDVTQHTTTNHVVTVNGDTANSVCYVHARFVRRGVEGGDFFETTGWYDDVHVRTPDGWRIKHRVSRSNWYGGNLNVLMTEEDTSEGLPLSTTRKDADAGRLMFLKALTGQ